MSASSSDAVFPRFGRLRDLIRPRVRRLAISTSLSQTEVVDRVRGIVEPGNNFLAHFSRTNKLFAGEVSATGFKIRRIMAMWIIWFGNWTWSPVILGTLETQPTGTRVRIAMRPTRFNTVFLWLWVVIVIFSFAPILSRQRTGSVPALTGIKFLAAALAGYLVAIARSVLEARKTRGLLEEALQTEPGDRMRQVLEGGRRRFPKVLRPMAALIVIGALMVSLGRILLVRSEPYHLALEYLGANSTIQKELGTLSEISPGWHAYSVRSNGKSEGCATFGIDLSGTRGQGVVFFALSKHLGVWNMNSAELHQPSGRVITLAGADQQPARPCRK